MKLVVLGVVNSYLGCSGGIKALVLLTFLLWSCLYSKHRSGHLANTFKR